jgi:hypothetical protein
LDQALATGDSARQHLLNLLARCPTRENLKLLAELFATRPPASFESVAVCLAALIRSPGVPYECLFPRLLDSIQYAHVAAAVLDFTNHLVRSGKMRYHPAKPRAAELVQLLGGLSGYLGQSEEWIKRNSSPSPERARQVSDSIELAVALCHTFGLMKERSAIGKLFQTSELSHRRLRVEAAAALAALGEDAGRKCLIELAAEPLVRLRVLAFSSELGLLDEIDPGHRSPEARAQAEMIVFLAEPTQFGFPPVTCELYDRREQYWPGYDEPVECFLFRYAYRLEHGLAENIGIVGPLTQAFSADLTHLSKDDIYALFAGWQAEHDEIHTMEIDENNSEQQVEIARFERRLHDAGYSSVAPSFVGSFFGQRSLIARAVRDGEAGIAIVDPAVIDWFADNRQNPRATLMPEHCYDIYKGRRLLASFNSD